jgi:hypothetical protein
MTTLEHIIDNDLLYCIALAIVCSGGFLIGFIIGMAI